VETFCLVFGLGLGHMVSTLRETRMLFNSDATVTAGVRQLNARSGEPTLLGSVGSQKA